MFKHKNAKGLRDAVLFGRVLSVGLVVAGYAFLGAWLSVWLKANDYPGWMAVAVLPAALLFGLWQGWLFLTRQAKPHERCAPHHHIQKNPSEKPERLSCATETKIEERDHEHHQG